MYTIVMKSSIVVVVVVGGLIAGVAAQDPSALSQASALEAELLSKLSPPQSIIPDLLEYVPPSLIADFAMPDVLPGIASSVAKSKPAWFSSLPPAALSWVIYAENAYDSLQPQIASLEAQLASSTTAPASNPSASTTGVTNSPGPTGSSNSTVTSGATTKVAGSATTTSTASATSIKASNTANSGGTTNGVAVGVMGAVGILGLALAL